MEKTRIYIIVICSILFTNVYAQHMEKHKWQNRILIVKSSDSSTVKYQEQLKEFKDSNSEFAERKLVLYQVIGEQYKLTDFQNLNRENSWKKLKIANIDILGKPEDFQIILVGLDGGVKLRKEEVLKKEELYSIIDKMPMRSEELRGNKK